MSLLGRVYTPNEVNPREFPFSIPAFQNGIDIELDRNVTFFVGENGSGKSTLLEAIAISCGFHPGGGGMNHSYQHTETESGLSKSLRLGWSPKRITQGFFMRAETFFNFATYIDQLEDDKILEAYGGKSLHRQSHGESFLALFNNRFSQGIYLLDEPEAALSPQRQLTLMSIIRDLEQTGKTQFIIATHSPILLAYPKAEILSFDNGAITSIKYSETSHYQITKGILNEPNAYFKELFGR